MDQGFVALGSRRTEPHKGHGRRISPHASRSCVTSRGPDEARAPAETARYGPTCGRERKAERQCGAWSCTGDKSQTHSVLHERARQRDEPRRRTSRTRGTVGPLSGTCSLEKSGTPEQGQMMECECSLVKRCKIQAVAKPNT